MTTEYPLESNSCLPYDLVVILRGAGLAGTERHTIDMVNHLVASGRRLAYVQAGIDLRAWGLNSAPDNLLVIPTSLPMRNLSRTETRAWSRLLKTLPAARVLLVKPWYFNASIPLLRVLRKHYPLVYHIEHSWPPELEKRNSRLHLGFLPGIGLWWYREWWQRWRMSRTADYVLAVSEAARQALLRNALLGETQVVTCPNGTNLDHWMPDKEAGGRFRRRYGIAEGAYLFGSVGRLVPLKGNDLAIRAFARLRQVGLTDAAYCVIGEGPYRPELERLARELDVADAVFFLEQIQDPRDAYSAIDTLLFPSVSGGEDSFPLVLGEAMACGCRVIASPVGGIPEVVGDPVCGELLSTREPTEWAEAMARHLQTSYEERSRLGAQIRAFVERAHDQRLRLQWLEKVLFSSPSQLAELRLRYETDRG